MGFADLMTRTNASVLAQLANARVRIDGGEEQPGIFKNPSSVAPLGSGIDDTSPTLTVSSAIVPGDIVDKTVEINGILFGVVRPRPDGTGLTVLTVEQLQ